MLSSIIAERYAKALVAAAEAAGLLDQVRHESAALITALESNPQLDGYLKQPLVRATDKAVFFSQALSQKFSKIFLQFLRVVFENKREAFLQAMLKQYLALADLKRSRIKVELSSPWRLKPAQVKLVGDALSDKLGRQVELTLVTNPAMLGGLRAKVGDKVFDGSLENQLKRLEESLLSETPVKALPAAPAKALPRLKAAAKPKAKAEPKAKAKPAAKAAPKKSASKKPRTGKNDQ